MADFYPAIPRPMALLSHVLRGGQPDRRLANGWSLVRCRLNSIPASGIRYRRPVSTQASLYYRGVRTTDGGTHINGKQAAVPRKRTHGRGQVRVPSSGHA